MRVPLQEPGELLEAGYQEHDKDLQTQYSEFASAYSRRFESTDSSISNAAKLAKSSVSVWFSNMNGITYESS